MDLLTLEEIQLRFTSEWVLVGDPELTESLAVIRGRVLWHSPNRDEVYRKARELRPQHSAILYTGTATVDGVLGLDFMRGQRVIVNFRAATVILE